MTKFFAHILNNEIISKGQTPMLNEGAINIEVTGEIYNNIENYKLKDGNMTKKTAAEIKKEAAKKERDRLDKLSLTAADVERAIYKARDIDFEDVLTLAENTPELDIKALKIELKANNFYRGNPFVSQIGAILGFTTEQLDAFFETGNYEALIND